MSTVLQHTHSRPGKLHRLTLALEEQDLHAVQGERLPEVVCHRVLLLLEDLGDLGATRDRV